jgi:hypothetical protein
MAIVIESGAGLANAEGYASVPECDAYFAKLGNVAWDEADDKEALIRKATQYIDAEYSFKGSRVSSLQALAWPRYGVVFDGYDLPSGAVPKQVKAACCELALRAMAGDLIADVAAQYAEEVSVGPIRKKMSGLANGGQKRFALVDALLGPLLRGGNGGASIQLVRS